MKAHPASRGRCQLQRPRWDSRSVARWDSTCEASLGRSRPVYLRHHVRGGPPRRERDARRLSSTARAAAPERNRLATTGSSSFAAAPGQYLRVCLRRRHAAQLGCEGIPPHARRRPPRLRRDAPRCAGGSRGRGRSCSYLSSTARARRQHRQPTSRAPRRARPARLVAVALHEALRRGAPVRTVATSPSARRHAAVSARCALPRGPERTVAIAALRSLMGAVSPSVLCRRRCPAPRACGPDLARRTDWVSASDVELRSRTRSSTRLVRLPAAGK